MKSTFKNPKKKFKFVEKILIFKFQKKYGMQMCSSDKIKTFENC